MTKYQPESLNEFRSRPDCERAVIFLHGFSGDRDDTWDRLPGIVGTSVADWDIYALGYATTFYPDFVGLWSGDPDLPILATMLNTQTSSDPLRRYKSLALVAHSMGGLIVQRALVDDTDLANRTEKVVLFGTPSAGLRKASWLRFWKRQLHNMACSGEFIATLRRDWSVRFGSDPSFDLVVVAGEQDQFVPAKSSLEPFARRFHRIVSGDHFSMVRVADANSPSVRLLVSIFTDAPAPQESTSPLALAAEVPDSTTLELIKVNKDNMSQKDVVRAALALERSGRRDEAMALLQQYQVLGTDVQGTLAGRIKRMWVESEDIGVAHHALVLYQDALTHAIKKGHESQIYYHAINVAFFNFVAFDRVRRAREMARLALDDASRAAENAWSVATQAEANLYLSDRDQALSLYRRMLDFEGEPWAHASTALQAAQIAAKLRDSQLADDLEGIFGPAARRVNSNCLESQEKRVGSAGTFDPQDGRSHRPHASVDSDRGHTA